MVIYDLANRACPLLNFPMPRLYAIIDAARTGARSPAAIAEVLLSAGVKLIQYRDKCSSSRTLFQNSSEIAALVRKANGVFIVNDRADVARAVDADGVHLGQDDVPVDLARRVLGAGKWLGYSTHVTGFVSGKV
jgi:thiamine-phosphate pyrophosphorylase